VSGRYILSPEAKRDIEQIRDFYLEEAGARVARNVLGQITGALRFLAATPGAGHRRGCPVLASAVLSDCLRSGDAADRHRAGAARLARS
jgi:plasmid stabilization system protein ParE